MRAAQTLVSRVCVCVCIFLRFSRLVVKNRMLLTMPAQGQSGGVLYVTFGSMCAAVRTCIHWQALYVCVCYAVVYHNYRLQHTRNSKAQKVWLCSRIPVAHSHASNYRSRKRYSKQTRDTRTIYLLLIMHN